MRAIARLRVERAPRALARSRRRGLPARRANVVVVTERVARSTFGTQVGAGDGREMWWMT